MGVTDDMIDAALEAWDQCAPSDDRGAMRAAIGAAFRAATPVAWGFFDPIDHGRLQGAYDYERRPYYVTPLYAAPDDKVWDVLKQARETP